MPGTAPGRSKRPGQAFLRNHGHEIWACDFLQVADLCFRPLFAFFVIALGTRRVVHVGVPRHPTDAWVAQQRREATPFGERPRFLLRDNDAEYGPGFERVTAATGIRVLRTPGAPHGAGEGRIVACPILGGLHHDYRRVA